MVLATILSQIKAKTRNNIATYKEHIAAIEVGVETRLAKCHNSLALMVIRGVSVRYLGIEL